MPRLSRRNILAGCLALAACQPAPSVSRAARSATPPGAGTIVEVESVPIHLARFGHGRPVCLIHGASGNLNDMTFRLGPALGARYEVIAVDRPGHGLSGLPDGGAASIDTQARLIRGALAAIGIERPIVLGHSYGGSVALAWAVAAPETLEALVLVAAPSQIWEGGLGILNDLLANPFSGPLLSHAIPRLVTKGYVEETLDSVFAPQSPPGGYLDHLRLDLVLRPGSLRKNARQLVALKEELRQLIPFYPALPMPIEVIHGVADQTVGLEIHSAVFAREVPGAWLTRLPGIGHMVHQVATAEVVGRIDAARRRAQSQ